MGHFYFNYQWGVYTSYGPRFLSLDGAVVLLSSGRSWKGKDNSARIDLNDFKPLKMFRWVRRHTRLLSMSGRVVERYLELLMVKSMYTECFCKNNCFFRKVQRHESGLCLKFRRRLDARVEHGQVDLGLEHVRDQHPCRTRTATRMPCKGSQGDHIEHGQVHVDCRLLRGSGRLRRARSVTCRPWKKSFFCLCGQGVCNNVNCLKQGTLASS
jgi:hypothetical protein